MHKTVRVLALLIAVAFMAGGTAMAQQAPPPQGAPPQGAPPNAGAPAGTQGQHKPPKCKSKPGGCPKKHKKAQQSPAAAPPAGQPPARG